MELFLELVLTVSLSFIITSLFVKLVAMQPMDLEKDASIGEASKIDRFQWMPLQEEVIKLEEPKSEGKSLVEFHHVAVVDDKEDESNLKRDVSDEDPSFESEENLLVEEERKSCEIEIESIEEGIECEDENEKDGWIEIGRQDFEELLGNRGGSS